jgi:hypothetical protein
LFPRITVNLSPPTSRSPSPRRKALPRMIGALHERNKGKRGNKFIADESSPETGLLQKCPTIETTDQAHNVTGPEFGLLADQPPPDRNDRGLDDMRRLEGSRGRRSSGKESKFRGLFKSGRIAEIVGNEVSKVGDVIRKRDGVQHSRQSSYASSVTSDDRESDDDRTDIDLKSEPKTSLRHLSTASEDASRRERDDLSNALIPQLPTFTPSSRQPNQNHPTKFLDSVSPMGLQGKLAVDTGHVELTGDSRFSESSVFGTPQASPEAPDGHTYSGDRRDSYGFGPALSTLSNRHQVRIGETLLHNNRPRDLETAHSWSIPSRSIAGRQDSHLITKREIQRVQALLLSSGIKAREICRRSEAARRTPPDFLMRSSVQSGGSMPKVSRLEEFDCAARNILQKFDNAKAALHLTMARFSKSNSPLKIELENLERLVNESLTPRVREAAADAENLSTELTTTSTLAVKQLSDALNKGIRKRNRRFRWVRRAGFVFLEWVVVGVMWWVWLIVMIFKILRGMWRGAISGIRWVLWL